MIKIIGVSKEVLLSKKYVYLLPEAQHEVTEVFAHFFWPKWAKVIRIGATQEKQTWQIHKAFSEREHVLKWSLGFKYIPRKKLQDCLSLFAYGKIIMDQIIKH